MPRTGFIDHIGIGVPDLLPAKRYYDKLMATADCERNENRETATDPSTEESTWNS